jgi:outer membrane protein OmpA-like peptidoglycan-associated protein
MANLLLWGLGVNAQVDLEAVPNGTDVVVHCRKQNESDHTLFQAIWRNVPGANAEFQVIRTSADGNAGQVMLDRLMETALGAYLDERIHFSKQGVTSDLPAEKLTQEMNAMIFASLEALGVTTSIPGLTTATKQQLARLVKIDWSQAKFSVDGGNSGDKYLAIYHYVRSQREELERQMRADLLPLATVQVLVDERVAHGQSFQIGSTCGTVFDDQNYLCALDLQLADAGNGSIDPELGLQISTTEEDPTKAEESRVRKRDRWLKAELDRINERIDKLDQRKELWELRDRMDDIEDRLTNLELEVQDDPKPSVNENPLAELSDLTGHNITIRFQRNSVELGSEYLVLLNEVFEQLARSPQDQVLITGYADRSGDPAVNLKLSERRARAVRNYLMQRGISPERLMVNYYGDSRSVVQDASLRRVEIEWLKSGK